MTDKLNIRLANYQDLFVIDNLIHRAWAEDEGLNFAPSYPHAYHHMLDLIASGLVVVAVEPLDEGKRERVVGVLALMIKSFDYNPQAKFFENAHYYVLQDYRSRVEAESGKLIGEALMDRAKLAADNTGAPLVLTVSSGDSAETKDRLARSWGLKRVGGSYAYWPEPADAETPVQEAAE